VDGDRINKEVIEDIILKTKEYDEKEIKLVFSEIAKKNPDNPKQNYSYAMRMIGRNKGFDVYCGR